MTKSWQAKARPRLCCFIVFSIFSANNLWGARPVNLEKIDSAQLGFSVYFSSQLFLEKAQRTLIFLEDAFRKQVTLQGFTAPNTYQIYLVPTAMGGARTAQDELGIYTVIDPALDDLLWASYIHHEWQHACQYAMGGPSSSLFMDEASAVLQEVLAFPAASYWLDALRDFQSYPQVPLFSSGEGLSQLIGASTKYEYGGALFLLFLEDKYGLKDGQLVRHLWQKREPWISAIEEVTKSSMQNLLMDFAIWRIRAENLYGDRGALKVRRLLQISDSPLLIHSEEMPAQLGCFFVKHVVKNNPISFLVSIKSKLSKLEQNERPLGIALLIIKKNQIIKSKHKNQFHSATNFTVHLQEDEEITMAICDLSVHLAFDKTTVHPIEVFLQKFS